MSVLRGRTLLITPRSFYKRLTTTLIGWLVTTTLGFAQHPLDFAAGQALFERNWVPSPASTQASDGLGPYYNARSCNQCHPNGGRGDRNNLVVHLDDPVYGEQLQPYARPGLAAEAAVSIDFNPASPSGLLLPEIMLESLEHGDIDTAVLSPRLPPSLRTTRLLERIPEETVLALADETDRNGDGISGRVNLVDDSMGKGRLGRFGWKASQASAQGQVSRALSLDLGLGNPQYPEPYGDCTEAQAECRKGPHGNSVLQGDLEASQQVVDLLLTYIRGIAPASGVDLAMAKPGYDHFRQAGCAECHVVVIDTGEGAVYPFTDLLLHDMGPGLADGLSVGDAGGQEWRTAPLRDAGTGNVWLHDGRASSLHEAILWHDGEGRQARENYLNLNERDRRDVITFLNSL